jgi:PAS domain S-box-containing protein
LSADSRYIYKLWYDIPYTRFFKPMETDITTIYMSLEGICQLTQEELFVLDLSTQEIIATSPAFDTLDNYYMAALKHWGSEERDYLVHQQDRAHKATFLRKLAQAEEDEIRTLRFRILNPTGGWESIEVCFKIIKRDLDANPLLIMGRLKKNSDQKQENNLLREVFDSSQQACMIWTPLYSKAGTIEDFSLYLINAEAEQVLGHKATDISGRHFSSLFAGSSLINETDRLVKIFRKEIPADEQEFRFQSVRLKARRVQDYLLLYTDKPESLVPQQPAMALDGHELVRKHQELEQVLQLRTQELQQKQEDYHCLLEATADVVWELNTLTNESKATVVSHKDGLSEVDLKEKLWVEVVHEDDWEQASTLWLQANIEKKKFHCKVRLKLRHGGYTWVISRGTPVLNQQGEIRKWVGSLTDIHEAVMAEEALQITQHKVVCEYEKLLRINELTDTYLMVVDHDLRSPINNIKLMLELMNVGFTEADKGEYLEIIQRSLLRLQRLNEGLSEINNIRSGIHVYNSITLAQELEKVKHDLQEEIRGSGAQIEAQLTQAPAFNYSACFAYHILRILITNAIQYAKPGEAPLIRLTASQENGYVVLCVADAGEGVDLTKNANHLYMPFRRCTTRGEGMGVGLFLIKSLLENNGGYVRMESEPGKGTSVYCYFKELVVEETQCQQLEL